MLGNADSRLMGIEVLGPLMVEGSDGIGPRDRVVLEVLVLRVGEYVAADVIADALWGETTPATWSKVVQGCVARLRKRLGATSIETSAYGYRLVAHDDQLDVKRFERLVARAREHLADGDPDRAAYSVRESLALWRGAALPDLDNWEPGRLEAERLAGLRMEAQEIRVQAEVSAGRARSILEDARRFVAEAPYRESRWALFARALYQAGRQTEALEVLQRARRMLLDELGLEPGPELIAVQEAILRQDPDLVTTSAPQASEACPYRGLLAYDAQDADAFFGREQETAAALQRLRERGVLVVVGASGTGKSSLVRAGVVAALRAEGQEVLVTTPGPRPLESLSALPRRGAQPVLVVDQAEEAVTLGADADEQSAYFAALDAHSGPLVVALRADHLSDLSAFTDFATLVETGLFLLAPMSEDNLRRAVEGPARTAGLRLEGGLVDLLVSEVRGEPGALPLLSHVLRQTWERREGATLTVEGYRATGGIRDAVARSAEALYEQLDETGRDRVRALFLRLVMTTDDGEPVWARVPRERVAVDLAHESLLESLVAARLVSSDGSDLQIAHEALAREWPRLRGWLEEDVAGHRIFGHLAAAAEAWDSMGRPDSELYRGGRLAAASEWVERAAPELTATETDFLAGARELGRREADLARVQLRQQRQANRRLRSALAGVAVLLVAAVVAGLLAVSERNRAQGNERQALAVLTTSDAHRLGLSATTSTDPATSLLLALEANRLEDSPTSRDALLKVLVREPHLVRVAGINGDLGDLGDLSVSPDGSTVAVASYAAEGPGLSLVDVATNRVVATYEPPVGRVRYVGADLVAVGLDAQDEKTVKNPVRLLDARSLEEVPDQLGGQGVSSVVRAALEVSADGRRLAAGFEEMDHNGNFGRITVRAWDLSARGKPEFVREGDRFPAVLGLTPRRLFFGSDGKREVDAYDLTSGLRVAGLEIPGDNGMGWRSSALAPDGRTLAVMVDDDVVLVDTRTMSVAQRWTNPGGTPVAPVFSRDGSRLMTMTVSDDGGFTVWSVPDGRAVVSAGRFGHSDSFAAFAPSRDTAYAVMNDSLTTWRLDRHQSPARQVPTRPLGRTVLARIGSRDGAAMVYVDSAGAEPGHFLLQVQDVESGRVLSSAQYPKVPGINDMAWSHDGGTVAATAGDSLRSFTKQDATPRVGPSLGVGHLQDLDAVGRDSFLVVSAEGAIVVVDATDLTAKRLVARMRVELDGAYVSADASTVLVSDTDMHWYVVDLEQGTATKVPIGAAWNVEPSPDGSRIVVTPEGGGVGLYDLRHRAWIAKPSPLGGGLPFFAPDGRRFVTTDGDTATLWDGRTGRRYASLKVPGTPDDLVATFPEETDDVVLSSGTGELHRWSMDRQDWLDEACRIAGRNLRRDEWRDLVGDRRYHRTCPDYPAGS